MSEDFFTGGKLYWHDGRKQWQGVLYYTDEGGRQRQKTRCFGPKSREAKRAFRDWKDGLNRKARFAKARGLIKEPAKLTVGERVEDYLRYLESCVADGNMEQSTLTAKMQSARLYIYPEKISSIPYQKLSRGEVLAWERGLRERGIANSTIGIPYSLIRRIYNHDIENGEIDYAPFRFIKSPKAKGREINYATDRTLAKLGKVLHRRWEQFAGDANVLCYILALYTGMRGGEICALAWKDVHLNKGYLDVTQAIGRNNGKPYRKSPKNNKSKRSIPIIDELSRYLKDRLKYVCLKEGVDEPEPHWFVVGERDKFKTHTRANTSRKSTTHRTRPWGPSEST